MKIATNIFSRRVFWHLLFWVLFYLSYVVLYYITNDVDFHIKKYILIGIFSIIAIAVYINLYLLIPLFLKKKQFLIYSTLFFINIFIFSFLRNIYILLFDLDFEDFFSELLDFAIILFVFLSITSGLKLFKEWLNMLNLEKKVIQAEKEKLEVELNSLKSQINPHFLFNVLNNIHSFVYRDPHKTAYSIIKLSDIMRYMLYEASEEEVFLEKEVNYLNSYLELQRIRLENPDFIKFTVTGDICCIKVPPFLFIPFIENAFKHGNKEGNVPGIIIELHIKDDIITFKVENYINHINGSETSSEKTSGGFGLQNIKQRLELLYPERYELKVDKTNKKYCVNLKILLK